MPAPVWPEIANRAADRPGGFEETYRRSLEQPEEFWSEAAADIDWDRPWERVLDSSRPPFFRWFAGGRLNTCYNALDRHVERGRADQPALIYDSPVTGTTATFTFRELRAAVARFAGALAAQGVIAGDRVVIYMPMVPEAVVAMLACARIGAVHSVVFGGFAANELASRIDDARPKVVVSASCGVEPGRVVPYKPLLDGAIDLVEVKPHRCIILQRAQLQAELRPGRDISWEDAVAGAEPAACVVVGATDPLYILYTSGTTGQPKGIVRDNGGHAVALKWSMRHLYDVAPGDVYWAASDIGWVVGHSYIVYGPLLHGCTTVLYEGKPVGTPDAGAFWRVISQHGVSTMFTAPTAFRAIRQQDPDGRHITRYDLASPSCPVPGRGALRPGDPSLGRAAARGAGDRPLVADGDGLGHRGQLPGCRAAARRGRLAYSPRPGVGPAGAGQGWPRGPGRPKRCPGGQAADAARRQPDAVER